MAKQIVNINNEQRTNLVNEIASLIDRFKKDKDVECIYFAPYKDLDDGYIVDFRIVIKGDCDTKNKNFCKYNELYREHEYIRKFGMQIYIMFDHAPKYTILPLNPSEVIRANNLFNSVIFYDKTGEYSKIKKETEKYLNITNSGVFEYENLAEIYPPIEELIKMKLETQDAKKFAKTKQRDLY